MLCKFVSMSISKIENDGIRILFLVSKQVGLIIAAAR